MDRIADPFFVSSLSRILSARFKHTYPPRQMRDAINPHRPTSIR
jgi:hypothetical protein